MQMTEQKQSRRPLVFVLIFFIFYEIFTAVLQFTLFIMSDLFEMGFDLLFILLLVFYFDVDALILLIELIPFIDLIPLFAIYMVMKIAQADIPRKPLINRVWFKWEKKEKDRFPEGRDEQETRILNSDKKTYHSELKLDLCGICKQELQNNEEIISCVNGHLAHVNHILPWTESLDREYCPICRVKYPRVLISKTYFKKNTTE